LDRNIQILEQYLPPRSSAPIAQWINIYQVELKITRSRQTKLGDYRAPHQGKPHRISINYNLNPYSFLITLIHEFAHLTCWNKYQFKVKPHGEEWKSEYKILMNPWVEENFFPEEIRLGLRSYMNNPFASSCTDLKLMRVLEQYDMPRTDIYSLESLARGTLFQIKDGRIFTKGDKLRKRFRCTQYLTNRIYLFNPLAKVFLVS
jgi:SprT protein